MDKIRQALLEERADVLETADKSLRTAYSGLDHLREAVRVADPHVSVNATINALMALQRQLGKLAALDLAIHHIKRSVAP